MRRAVALEADREAITEAATFGAGTVNQTAIPEGSFWADDYAPFEQDAAAAEQLPCLLHTDVHPPAAVP